MLDQLHGLMDKRVMGIPVLYLAGAFVVILGVVAWKMKASEEPEPSGDAGSDGEPGSGDGEGVTTGNLAGSVYDNLKTAGTVVVAPSPTDDTSTPVADVYTNEEWQRDGVAWLTSQNKASGTAAASALSKYMQGQDRSYTENELVNAWIAKKGLPPSMPDSTGNVASKPAVPAKKQGNPPCMHTVKGSNDNTLAKLGGIYYGRGDAATIDMMQASNPNIKNDVGPFPVGFRVRIPVWHTAKYYVTPSPMTTHQVAAKNGLATWSIEVLNNTTRTTWPKGARVRVA